MRLHRPCWIALLCAAFACASSAPAHDAGAESESVDAAPPGATSTRDASAPAVICTPATVSAFGDNVAFDCARCRPHGTCPSPDPDQGECRCFEGYTGARCELCADGYVEQQGACVTPCRAAGLSCAICTGTVAAPACECPIGYEGTLCDRCSPGFGPDPRVGDALVCIPTCGGACGAEEVCIAPSRNEQHCECVAGYERDAVGGCSWQGFTADPEFEQGCEHWQLFRRVANPNDSVVAEIAPSALTLSVDHRCSAAGATADAYLPAQDTLPRAALAITASGNVGASLYVTFRAPVGPVLTGVGEGLTGTGDWERYVVCMPVADQGRKEAITLVVGEPGACMDPLDAAFTVQSLEAISHDQCEN